MTHQEKQKEQSKEWIADAFFTLLKKKNYDTITVSEIAKKANLSRRTFYRAFHCKQGIITYMFEKIFPDYLAALKELPIRKRDSLAIAIVAFVNRHLDFFRCLERNHLDYLIIDFFDNNLATCRNEIWGHPFSEDEEIEQVFLMTVSVEHYNIIRLWLGLCDKKTPDEMSQLVSNSLALFKNFQ